jgi:hypothetical protein
LHQIRKDALHITMFGFLTPGTKESMDPLASPKAVSAWLRPIAGARRHGRQQQVMRAFER